MLSCMPAWRPSVEQIQQPRTNNLSQKTHSKNHCSYYANMLSLTWQTRSQTLGFCWPEFVRPRVPAVGSEKLHLPMKFSDPAQHKYSCGLHTYNLAAGAFQSHVANLAGRHMNIAVRCFICPGSRRQFVFPASAPSLNIFHSLHYIRPLSLP